MEEWFRQFDEALWLAPDDGGEAEARFLTRALGLQAGTRVLDAPCGAGRIALHLARAGCLLTGVDLNPRFIARAQQRFAEAAQPGLFLEQDLRRLDFHETFDAACCWHGSFGFFSDDDNLRALRHLTRAVRPGGLVLIDQPNREHLLRHFQPILTRGELTIHTRWHLTLERVESTYIRPTGDGEQRSFSSIRLYTPAQLRRLFTEVGLTWDTAYGGPDATPHHRTSRRLIVVGRKNG